MFPTVGRIVHYRLKQGRNAGKVRPAVIVEPWSESQGSEEWKGKVNLVVFLDGANDRGAQGEIWDEFGPPAVYTFMWVGSAEHDEIDKKPGAWFWPPRV